MINSKISDVINPPNEILKAGLNGDLVLFVGAGVSMLQGLPSWDGLASSILEDLRKQGIIDFSELEQLKTLDAKKQLSIAELIAKEKGVSFNVKKFLLSGSSGSGIYKYINEIGCPCVTTNYDELLSPNYSETVNGSTTHSPVTRINEKEKFFPHLLNEPGTVIHLHGSVSREESMIVTTKDYLVHYDDENVQQFLGVLFERKVVLFIGYGLEESEVLEHILRRGQARKSMESRRFLLLGFFRSQEPLFKNLHNYYEKSFGVHLLGFERDKENYNAQERIVKDWSRQIKVQKTPLIEDVELMDEVFGDE